MKCRLVAAGWIVLTLGLLCMASVARADTVTLLPIEDATISEKSLTSSMGKEITLDAGTTGPLEGAKRNRALLKFDLATIPSHALVTSVTLTMTVVQTPPLRTELWFSLHRVFQGWNETAVTWTNRVAPPAGWNVPGGAPPTDYSSSITQSNRIGERARYTFASNTGMVADVQHWLSNPGQNFGWIVLCAAEELERSVRKFGSREAATASTRPSLEVQFTVPPPVNHCPSLVTHSFVTAEDTPLNLSGLASDPEGDPLTYAATQPAHGTITGAGPNLVYTPAADYHGTDSFALTVSDGSCSTSGTVNLNITPVDDAPVARIAVSPVVDLSPEMVNPVIISPNGSNATLHFDGSQSSDVESPPDALSAFWMLEPASTPFATGFIHDTAQDLGTHIIVLTVVDPEGTAGTARLAVDVVSTGEALEGLIQLVDASAIERGNKRPFIATLKAAVVSDERGQNHTAANQLRAFQNKVRAQVAPRDAAEAAKWIRWAQYILDAFDGA